MNVRTASHLDRFMELCERHRNGFAAAAADVLDGGTDLAGAFARYSDRCAAGDGCDG